MRSCERKCLTSSPMRGVIHHPSKAGMVSGEMNGGGAAQSCVSRLKRERIASLCKNNRGGAATPSIDAKDTTGRVAASKEVADE